MVNFGIIGLGAIAERFAGVLTSGAVKGVKLYAVAANGSVEKARKFAARFGAEKFYGNYEELAENPDVDVVYVATTHNFHAKNAQSLISRNSNIICEKPFFINKREAEETAALAKEAGVFITEAMWTRYLPAVKKAREWARNAIGDVGFIDASFCFNMPFNADHRLYNPDLAGGALLDAGVYPIEFVTGIAGEKPEKVSAFATKAVTGVDDKVIINMAFKSGALGQARCSISCLTNGDAHIYGTAGSIIVYDFLRSKVAELYDADGNLLERFEDAFEDGFCYEIEYIAKMVEQGLKDSAFMPIADTIDCAGIFDEILKGI